ncbi:MAG: endo-1,4-beta-xylanase [Phycisphaerae bacterium]|nr:endo-1,4-beta-xylanase [Phycisphaerae bacterium]
MKRTLRTLRIVLPLVLLASTVGGAQAGDATDTAIAKHRTGTIVIRTKPGAAVSVTQKSHEFQFGTAIARTIFRDISSPASKKYLEILKANFNSAVCENAMKWYGTQRNAGPPDYSDADRMVAWCQANNLPLRGHCIFWASPRYVQNWVKALDNKQLLVAMKLRNDDLLKRFRGKVGEYDVNNEMVHVRYYADRLGDDIRVRMFHWARKADPKAILYVNDYNILSGRDGDKYVKHIEKLIAAGAPVGGIGVQGHFHRRINIPHVKKTLDSLAKFKLPIKVTEFDINTSDEKAKAADLTAFYRACFAHPSVEGILMWGFWEGRHWRPKAALWKRDFTPAPAARAYRKLVYETWWTRWSGKADASGRCQVPAYFGRHIVKTGGKSMDVTLLRAKGKVELDTRKPVGKKSETR